jgi:hypothetical protein
MSPYTLALAKSISQQERSFKIDGPGSVALRINPSAQRPTEQYRTDQRVAAPRVMWRLSVV